MTEESHPVAARIRQALERGLAPSLLDVVDDSRRHAKHAHMMSQPGTAGTTSETHFKIKVVADRFTGKSRIERHRAINALLAEEMGPGKVHAIAIDARAPGE